MNKEGITNQKDIQHIVLSVKNSLEDKTKCLQKGANDYMTKPLSIEKEHRILRLKSIPISLTKIEYSIIKPFVQNNNFGLVITYTNYRK